MALSKRSIGKKGKSRSLIWTYLTVFLTIAMGGMAWWIGGHEGSSLNPLTAKEDSAYDQYVAKAKQKGWFPVDPMDKIRTTISKMGQVVDPANMGRSQAMNDMLVQEFHYIIRVFGDTRDRSFDLSLLLIDALEMLKISYFKIMKHHLQAGSRSVHPSCSVPWVISTLLITGLLLKPIFTHFLRLDYYITHSQKHC